MVVHTTTAEETEGFGAQLASTRPAGDNTLCVVYLTGDLGAGKTTLTRGLLRSLGVTGAVRSPTYTLVEFYEIGTLTTLHLDLYRLNDAAELDNLGLREWARGGHLWLIEWPERGAGRLPGADLVIKLVAGDGGHDIEVTAASALGAEWLGRLAAAAAGAPAPSKDAAPR
ncbi:MAG TPA: tRNA (adenosine(37)-N6)-threonylcarbamoyltransferase complex ATPase subunit type 1 TsaE [Steroidobacteraceae bacterium]|nr:tRNA (adenosine(37)-N6)-threonylcarbamoyltransferase complex ATPase subunit type 1 TsaE [Steroidobacteraceae bacterium]